MARPRKPTAVKVLAGTAQNCRLNKDEPKPNRGIPLCPKHLSPIAKTAWKYVASVLDEMGVLTTADGMAVEGLCSAYAELREARAALAKRGSPTYETFTESGSKMYRAYPEVAMISDADRRYRTGLAAVGMTPSDRSRVSAKAKEDENPWSDF